MRPVSNRLDPIVFVDAEANTLLQINRMERADVLAWIQKQDWGQYPSHETKTCPLELAGSLQVQISDSFGGRAWQVTVRWYRKS